MAQKLDIAKLQEGLVDAFEWNEDERLRELVSRLAAHPRQARAMLDEMLASEDAGVRRAAAFALGELGGPASAKRLEQQMAIEEAREDYDGSSVLEVITQTLGRINEAGARASLIRRLKRLIASNAERGDISEVAYALWRKRHPELIPVIRSALEEPSGKQSKPLHALLHLLETPPEALVTWAQNPSVALEDKKWVLEVFNDGVPEELFPAIPAFISAATALGDTPVKQKGEASKYCERLFTMLMCNTERLLPALSAETQAELRALARRCVASVSANCSIRAADMLVYVGRPEDASLVEAHRPADELGAKFFDEIARKIRERPSD